MDEVERIVAGLSKAQRAALSRAEAEGHLGKFFIRWWVANGPTLRALRNRGLGSPVWSGLVLTPLGLRARAALEREMKRDPA